MTLQRGNKHYLLLFNILLKLFVSELRSTNEIGTNNQYENEK
jgi:hypothetical protein